MIDRALIYDVLYALAARDGREAALFGTCSARAHEAFLQSVAGEGFPELWFEVPLAGDPWFDLHALTARSELRPGMPFSPDTTGGRPEAFSWFAAQSEGVRQLALSWDISSGEVSVPAVQLLVNNRDPEVVCGFLASVGRSDASDAYRTFVSHIPREWFACYTGVFPQRKDHNLRVECIPDPSLQAAYAQDAGLLEEHLRRAGFEALGETLVPRCQQLAGTPFRLEFQFDVERDGSAGPTLGASVRFSMPPGTEAYQMYDARGAAGDLMRQVQSWGLADERWQLLADTAFAKRLSLGYQSATLYCCPTFLKLRWRDGEPLDAKLYLIAGVQ